MAKKLEELIRQEASVNASRYNLAQYAKRKEHHNICVNLVKIADANDFPMGVLVYIAVGTSAHKPSVFEKGYTHFDEKKAEKIIKLATIIDKKLNEGAKKKVNYRTNDRIIHTLSRYYDLNKGNEVKLRQVLKIADLDSIRDYLKGKNPTAKIVAQLLFGDEAEYRINDDKKAYMIGINAVKK